MSENMITLTANTDELTHALSDIKLHIANAPREVIDLFLRRFNALSKIFRLETSTAPGARIAVTFKPTDGLLNFMGAMRAGEFQRLIVESEFVHDNPFFEVDPS